eukprot:3448938-Alexandrium_andersonii.AAC.1
MEPQDAHSTFKVLAPELRPVRLLPAHAAHPGKQIVVGATAVAPPARAPGTWRSSSKGCGLASGAKRAWRCRRPK